MPVEALHYGGNRRMELAPCFYL